MSFVSRVTIERQSFLSSDFDSYIVTLFVPLKLNYSADSACTFSDHVQCHVEPTKRHKTRRAAGEELIVMHDCTNATGALSTVKKNTSQPRIRLTNLFCTATPLHTHTHTHTRDNYNNPRCAHARYVTESI